MDPFGDLLRTWFWTPLKQLNGSWWLSAIVLPSVANRVSPIQSEPSGITSNRKSTLQVPLRIVFYRMISIVLPYKRVLVRKSPSFLRSFPEAETPGGSSCHSWHRRRPKHHGHGRGCGRSWDRKPGDGWVAGSHAEVFYFKSADIIHNCWDLIPNPGHSNWSSCLMSLHVFTVLP